MEKRDEDLEGGIIVQLRFRLHENEIDDCFVVSAENQDGLWSYTESPIEHDENGNAINIHLDLDGFVFEHETERGALLEYWHLKHSRRVAEILRLRKEMEYFHTQKQALKGG